MQSHIEHSHENKYKLKYLESDENNIISWRNDKNKKLSINPFPYYFSKKILELNKKYFGINLSKHKKNFFLIFLIMLTFLIFLLNLSASFFENTLILQSGDGFLEDYVNWSHILVIGAIIILFKKLYHFISIFFIDLSNVIDWSKDYSPDTYLDLKKNTEKMIQARGYFFIILLLFIIGGVYLSYNVTYVSQIDRTYDIWHSLKHPLGLSVYFIYNLITMGFILPILSYQFIMTMIMIIKIPKKLSFLKVLDLIPLEPNESGGMYICGRIAIILYYIIFTPMIFVISGLLRQVILADTGTKEFNFLIYIPIYMIPLIIIFLIPIISIHFSMIRAKTEKLNNIGNSHNYYFKIFNNIKKHKASKDDEIIEKIHYYNQLYKVVNDCPEWPINQNNTIKKFIIPFIIFIVPYIIPYMTNLVERFFYFGYF